MPWLLSPGIGGAMWNDEFGVIESLQRRKAGKLRTSHPRQTNIHGDTLQDLRPKGPLAEMRHLYSTKTTGPAALWISKPIRNLSEHYFNITSTVYPQISPSKCPISIPNYFNFISILTPFISIRPKSSLNDKLSRPENT